MVSIENNNKIEAGRFFLIGWEGNHLDEPLELIEHFRPAGLIFFRRNYPGSPEGLALQLKAIKKRAADLGLKPFILAIDNEGGDVKRLPPPFIELPKAASKLEPNEIKKLCYDSGLELRSIGFNLNLAPVLDVDVANGIMKTRSFGLSAQEVILRARAFIEGFESSGILTCGKHFPGLGAATLDPHKELPTVDLDLEELLRVHLEPFRALRANLSMVMTTHSLYPALDSKMATFSEKIVKILRKDIGFDGLALSDDMEMGAVTANIGPGEAAIAATLAGHDLILVCRSRAVIEASVKALEEKIHTDRSLHIALAKSQARLKNLVFWQ
ncbi:MAG: beta-N-acetylhexosaminidase [Deltaproteobacteria bacterium]|jgi:beta-N-acetylhexosaminidase|nr:beta-N-acetylhexosaminidase [Deltaproteobacteria bacterium]